jgi:hypothetical protein
VKYVPVNYKDREKMASKRRGGKFNLMPAQRSGFDLPPILFQYRCMNYLSYT